MVRLENQLYVPFYELNGGISPELEILFQFLIDAVSVAEKVDMLMWGLGLSPSVA